MCSTRAWTWLLCIPSAVQCTRFHRLNLSSPLQRPVELTSPLVSRCMVICRGHSTECARHIPFLAFQRPDEVTRLLDSLCVLGLQRPRLSVCACCDASNRIWHFNDPMNALLLTFPSRLSCAQWVRTRRHSNATPTRLQRPLEVSDDVARVALRHDLVPCRAVSGARFCRSNLSSPISTPR